MTTTESKKRIAEKDLNTRPAKKQKNRKETFKRPLSGTILGIAPKGQRWSKFT
jgi:hypothetical protein